LRKDFIIDHYQIYESRLIGADLILLIARILSRQQIADFVGLASKLKLEVLIELADEMDVEKIPSTTDSIILGVNNRNLHNFEVTVENSIYLQPFLPTDIPAISESGIHTAEQCRILYEKGFSGVLIGEALMRAESPQKLLMEFRNGVENAMQAENLWNNLP
jgi:indole-3-glycerol phosphate synthase